MFSKRSFVRESGSCNFSNAKNVLRPCLRLSAATAAAVVLLSGTPAWAAVHTVVPGESLWSISRLYGTTVEELQAVNNLKGDLLMPGQKLTVPEKVVSAPAAAATATAQKAPAPAPKAPAPQVRHTVQDGETLHGIGQKYSVSPEAIMAANKLQSDLIHPGQVLVIPVVDSAKDKRVTAELSRGGTDRGDSEMLLSFATSPWGGLIATEHPAPAPSTVPGLPPTSSASGATACPTTPPVKPPLASPSAAMLWNPGTWCFSATTAVATSGTWGSTWAATASSTPPPQAASSTPPWPKRTTATTTRAPGDCFRLVVPAPPVRFVGIEKGPKAGSFSCCLPNIRLVPPIPGTTFHPPINVQRTPPGSRDRCACRWWLRSRR